MPELLVTTDWLADHLNEAQVRVIDIRGHVLPASAPKPHYFNHRADYDVSHLPGAVFIDWVLEITDPVDPRHAQIAPPDRFAAVMRQAGISGDTQVIAYDDAQGMFAARLWWALNYYGHSRVAILDGGWQKWLTEEARDHRCDSGYHTGEFYRAATAGLDSQRGTGRRSPAGRADRRAYAGRIHRQSLPR